MPVLDLTRCLSRQTPVYSGTPAPEIEPCATMREHGFRERTVHLTTHTGTHCDAPAHVLAQGATLDQLPVEIWTGPGFCLDLRQGGAVVPERVTAASLRPLLPPPDVLRGGWLLLLTGWAGKWDVPHYFTDHPELTPDAAKLLAQSGLHGLGMDMPSPERADRPGLPVHTALLGAGCVLAENLHRLERLPAAGFTVVCAPLHLAGADGAPCRCLALWT